MSRENKQASSESHQQLSLDFDAVVGSAKVYSREEVAGGRERSEENRQGYDPTAQTAVYMRRAVQFEEAWETTVREARERLLSVDARELYWDFFTDLKSQIEHKPSRSARLADLLERVAQRGLGMSRQQISVRRPAKGGTRWKVDLDEGSVQEHLDNHIVGDYFLNPVVADDAGVHDRAPLIGASDVSQHRSAVPVPARFFKRSVPFVLNNAAGTLFELKGGNKKYENVFNPKPDDSLLRWMLIDPSYQDELEPEDYERCIASAMDVGQYKFDFDYLMRRDRRRPEIILRDGSLFPQDAYLDNFVIDSKRGDFTREAIRELLGCLSYAEKLGVIYCGVSKNVQLKVYSAVVDWFIERHIDNNWEVGNYTLNDGQAMSLLMSSPSFVGEDLKRAVSTCLIRRSFTTRANLNTRADLNELADYFARYEDQDIDITPYKELCKIAHVYMFFIGHSKSPQQQLPRYEFFFHASLGSQQDVAQRVLRALHYCGLTRDEDHSFMADKPISYLLPSVTQHAHRLSKDVGKYIDSATGQRIMARHRSLVFGAN